MVCVLVCVFFHFSVNMAPVLMVGTVWDWSVILCGC